MDTSGARDLIQHALREAVRHGAFFLPARRRIALERRLRGREEVRKLQQADVVVVSFGKSGRTWLRVMLSRFYARRHGLGDVLLGFDNLHRRHAAIPRIFFTHDNYIQDHTGRRDKSAFYDRKVVLLVRDPPDVAVSQYFQWKHRMRRTKKALNDYPPHGADVPIFEFVMHPGGGLPKILDFMSLWAREMGRCRALITVRYEDLRRDPEQELGRILRFMGEAPDPEAIRDAVAYASVENMRQLERSRSFWRAGTRLAPGRREEPDSYKVRRAKVGGWRDYLEPGQIAAVEQLVSARLAPGFGYRADEQADPRRADAVPA